MDRGTSTQRRGKVLEYVILILFSVIYGFEGQSHSIVAQEELTRIQCSAKAYMMRKGRKDLQIPFTVEDSMFEKPIFESVYYVCVPTKLEPK